MKNPFVLNQLLQLTNENHQKDANYSIAKVLVENFSKLPDMTISEAADLCFVSNASISRFVRFLGYSGFSEFKASCESSLGIETDYSMEVKKAKKEDLQPIYTRFTDQVISNIHSSYENIDIEQLDRICRQLQNANKIGVFGLEFSSLIGEHIQSRMARMHKLVETSLDLKEQQEIAKGLDEDSAAILITMEGGYLYRNPSVIHILENSECEKIVFTITPHIKMLQFADEILVCGKENFNTEARISLFYLVEILLMHYSISYFQKQY